MKQNIAPGRKIICLNRKASFNYFFLETLEAGISLKGSEVKSLRDGKGSIADSYAIDNNGELFLINSHIPLYRQSSYNNHNPKGDRKLLLKKKEINKLIGRINQEGLTIIPTKMYFVKGKVKIEIANIPYQPKSLNLVAHANKNIISISKTMYNIATI